MRGWILIAAVMVWFWLPLIGRPRCRTHQPYRGMEPTGLLMTRKTEDRVRWGVAIGAGVIGAVGVVLILRGAGRPCQCCDGKPTPSLAG